MDPALRAGATLFHSGALYEAHEAWEEEWRAEGPGERRELLQGLVQVAVALLHRDRGNAIGAARVGARAAERLAALPAVVCGLDIEGLRASFAQALVEPPGSPHPRLRSVG
ncbi:MAG: hypothetical protein AMXMBFR64_01520 [Myxococcales bacterium]